MTLLVHYKNKYLNSEINSKGKLYFYSRLAIFDCLFIVDSLIQKSILPYFTAISPREPKWFMSSFPYFWHPIKGMIRTITIYMMVVISAERYRTVCYPLCKRHVSWLINSIAVKWWWNMMKVLRKFSEIYF